MTDGNGATAVLVFAHGSSIEEANRGVRDLARKAQELGPFPYVRAAFLDPVEPSLGSSIAAAVEAGFSRIVVVPYFLTLGVHLRRDLPNLLAAQKTKYPGIEMLVAPSLDDHPLMPSILLGRVREVTDATKVVQ